MTLTVTEGVTAIGQIVPTITDFVKTVLELFMEPPLIFFTGAAFAVIAFKIGAYLLRQARAISS